jgi:hypothetical protein
MANKVEIFQKLLLNTIVFENVLKMFKSNLYRELIDDRKQKINIIENSTNINSKQKRIEIKQLKSEIEDYEIKILRSEKYNNEITKSFQKNAIDIDAEEFALNTSDLYLSFSDLIIKLTQDENFNIDDNLKIIPSLLTECDDKDYDILINDKPYKIII